MPARIGYQKGQALATGESGGRASDMPAVPNGEYGLWWKDGIMPRKRKKKLGIFGFELKPEI